MFWNFETNVTGLDFVLFVGRIRTRIVESRASGDVLSIVHDSKTRTLNKDKSNIQLQLRSKDAFRRRIRWQCENYCKGIDV